MLWVTNWFRKGARDTYRDVRVKIARVNAFLQEHISGIGVVQLFRREAGRPPALRRGERRAPQGEPRLDLLLLVFYPALDFLSAVGMASIVWYGGGEVIRGRMTLGAVVAFLQYSKRFYRPLMDLSEKYNILQAAMASSERIFQLLDEPPTITAPADPVVPEGPLRGDVVFEDTRFSYKTGRGDPEGRFVPRGAGADGRARRRDGGRKVHDPEPPPALLRRDGGARPRGRHRRAPVRPVELRKHFGIVLQDTFLFTGTIAENVSFFDPEMPRARIEEACLEVGLGPLLARIPGGLDAKLSERGGGLSVGEKQLVAFARALARDPRVLILDEATSSVDPETERTIEHAVGRLLAAARRSSSRTGSRRSSARTGSSSCRTAR